MTLKKILATAAVVGTVVCAAPVAVAHDVGAGAAPAPYYGGYGYPYGGRGWDSGSDWEDGSFMGDTRGSGRGTGSGEGEFNMNFSGKGRGNMDANTDWDGSGYGGSNNPYYYGGRGYGAPYGYGAPRMAPPAAPAAPAKK